MRGVIIVFSFILMKASDWPYFTFSARNRRKHHGARLRRRGGGSKITNQGLSSYWREET